MAEKIDKNEYVDNSKVFFDFLLHTHQWSNITPVEYAKWLSNFNDIPDGQYIACRLLNRFLYYSDKDIKKLLVDAINDVYSQQVVSVADHGIYLLPRRGIILKSKLQVLILILLHTLIALKEQHLCVMMVDLLLTVKKRQNRRMILSYQIPLLARSQKRRKNIGKQGMFLPQANDMKQNCYGRI